MSVITSRQNHRLNTSLFEFESIPTHKMGTTHTIPAANVEELSGEYIIRLAVPGMERPCFQVQAHQKELIIACDKEKSAGSSLIAFSEYNYEAWERRFVMPDDADTALTQASYVNGELVLHIPKNEAAINNTEVVVCIY